MLCSYSEILAYIHEEVGIPNNAEGGSTRVNFPKSAFGGFKTWLDSATDFILIAENSEIHGPNPLFTIPSQLCIERDLNLLSTQILSADYQGLSNNKSIAGSNAQLLMPDIAPNVHAAINYFIVFDTDARGFVHPVCLAYVTCDKNKLVNLAKSILEALSKAASFIQHSNVHRSKQDLKLLLQDFKLSMSEQENPKFPLGVAESVLRDIEEILDIVGKYELNNEIEDQIKNFMRHLEENIISDELKNVITRLLPIKNEQPEARKFSFQAKKDKKPLKTLVSSSPGGSLLALYHLYLMFKYFSRKYENIKLAETATKFKGDLLYYGACITKGKWEPKHRTTANCVLGSVGVPKTFTVNNAEYLKCLDSSFERILQDFFMCQKCVSDKDSDLECSSQSSSDRSNSYSSSSGHYSNEFVTYSTSKEAGSKPCSHASTLVTIWDTIDYLERKYIGIEKLFMKVLLQFEELEKILYSVLTRTLLVIICTPKELFLAQNFVRALTIFAPRSLSHSVSSTVDLHHKLHIDQLKDSAVVNICLSNSLSLEDFLSPDLMPLVCILNMKDNSISGPKYKGCLLSGLNQRLQLLTQGVGVFSLIVSVLVEIEMNVSQWRAIAMSSVDSSIAARYMLSKGFTRHDIQIVQKLSELCSN